MSTVLGSLNQNAPAPRRTLLLEANLARPSISETVRQVVKACLDEGLSPRMLEGTLSAVGELPDVESVPDSPDAALDCEIVLVLGGDGTFLRACQYAREADVPVLGVNLGRIGFLAESEAASLTAVVAQIASRQYHVVDRMTIDIVVRCGTHVLGRGWALNEASVEKVERQGVLETSIEIDGRPVSNFGCDGVLVSTPTGSTAYAFSAGGPIVWPDLDAILVVPNNAHALFARPMVVSPSSRVAVETGEHSGAAVAGLDGRTVIAVPPGSRVEVTAGVRPVRWVRLDDSPFTDRLVRKFRLPVTGWRGPADPSRPE